MAEFAYQSEFGVADDESEDEYDVVKRKLPQSSYYTNGKSIIDFVLAYQPDSGGKRKLENARFRQKFEAAMKKEGLLLEYEGKEQSEDGKTAFVKIHTPWEAMTRQAEYEELQMPIMESDIKPGKKGPISRTLHKLGRGKKRSIFDLQEDYILPEKEYFTDCFEREREDQFIIYDKDTFFSSAQRANLTWSIITGITISLDIRKKKKWGAGKDIISQTKDDAPADGGADTAGRIKTANMSYLLRTKTYTAAYPIHDGEYVDDIDNVYDGVLPAERWPLRKYLFESWAKPKQFFRHQPLNQIREYYGEKVSIYFAWLGFYTKMLILPTVVGIITFGWGVYNGFFRDSSASDYCNSTAMTYNWTLCRSCATTVCPYVKVNEHCKQARITRVFDNYGATFFSLFMAIWTVMFLEKWKRYQSELCARWDVSDQELAEEQVRSDYTLKVSTTRLNPVTQRHEPYLPQRSIYQRISMSLASIFFFVCVVLALLATVMIYKLVGPVMWYNLLPKKIDEATGHLAPIISPTLLTAISASVLNGVFIALMTKIYMKVAWKLTETEMPRTESQFENSYTYKVFIFQFVNFYGALFYLSFYRGSILLVEPPSKSQGFQATCPVTGCLLDVSIQLFIIMTGKQALNNCLEMASPLLKNLLRKYGRADGEEDNVYTRWERDFDLEPEPALNLFGDYLEMLIQYGFITMFVPAFPLAPLFALLNNIIEIRLDAYKMLTQTRRYGLEVACITGRSQSQALNLFGDYLEMLIQYGFITMFVPAFPLAPLFALLSNIIEIRLDAYKMLTQTRRYGLEVACITGRSQSQALNLFGDYLEMLIQYGFITMFVPAFPLAPLFALLSNIIEIRLDAYKMLTQTRRYGLEVACITGRSQSQALNLFGDYLEMLIQYGFITMFVPAFPLAPLFALLNNIIEIRLDAYKMLTQTRRYGLEVACITGRSQSQALNLFGDYLEMLIQYGFITMFVPAVPLAPLFALLNNIIEIRRDAYKMLTQTRRYGLEVACITGRSQSQALNLFGYYLEMLIQYGFITMFVPAFPLAPLFALLNNIIEIRIDAYKMLTQTRRYGLEVACITGRSQSQALNLFGDYLEMLIQYGFITMFVPAFPLAPLFALLNNIIEIRLDAYKMLTQTRRYGLEVACITGRNQSQVLNLFGDYLEMLVQYCFITTFVPAFPLAPLFALLNNIIEIRLDAYKMLTQTRRYGLEVSCITGRSQSQALNLFGDYLEMLIQYGFITMFIPAFPLAPLFALLNNIIEIRLDAYKMLTQTRRYGLEVACITGRSQSQALNLFGDYLEMLIQYGFITMFVPAFPLAPLFALLNNIIEIRLDAYKMLTQTRRYGLEVACITGRSQSQALNLFGDYLEMLIQYGFITMFVPAFPLAPLFALLNNIIEIRLDAYKLLTQTRRYGLEVTCITGMSQSQALNLFGDYLEMLIQYGFITMFVPAFPLAPLFTLLNNIIEIRLDAYKMLTQTRRYGLEVACITGRSQSQALNLFGDYLEMLIQYGFITMFVPAFPLAPLFALLNNIIEIRLDAYKMLTQTRRYGLEVACITGRSQSQALNLFGDYLEMLIQYGFITMFVPAFPLAPLFALLNNIIEIRLDAYKMLTQTRRYGLEVACITGRSQSQALHLFGDYMEMLIQYGFITMFVPAFPLAPLFALLNNIIEIRLDAYKMLTQTRRYGLEVACITGRSQSQALNLFGDYLEMLIQYGFITMFVPAFPLAPLFALLNNIIEIRLDAYKMLTQTRRYGLEVACITGRSQSQALNLFGDYLEMLIQYGFITMFVPTFPLAPLFALLNNIIEIRLDAYKMLTQTRRYGLEVACITGRSQSQAPNLFGDYLEMLIQYGFITMFVPAFPLAPLFALLNNIIEIRLDAYKMLTQTRRCLPVRAKDLGPWFALLEIVSRLAVITNAAFIALATNFVDNLVYNIYHNANLTVASSASFLDFQLTRVDTEHLYCDSGEGPTTTTTTTTTTTAVPENDTDYLGDLLDDALKLNADCHALRRFSGNKSDTHADDLVKICYYRSYRHPTTFERNKVWYHVVMAKLAFIILFEHLVLIVQKILGYLIPDTPDHVVIRLQREAFLQHQAFKEHELGPDPNNGAVDPLADTEDVNKSGSILSDELAPGASATAVQNGGKENASGTSRQHLKRPFLMTAVKKIMFC